MGKTLLPDLSISHSQHPIRVICDLLIVSHKDNGQALVIELLKHVHHMDAIFLIQASCGLVRQQNLRPCRHRPGDSHALLLPAGKL